MARVVTLMMLMILGALAVRTQSPDRTQGLLNGLAWREYSPGEKALYTVAAMGGYIYGADTMHKSKGCSAALPMWVESRSATKLGIMKEMDSFYQNGANISLPIANVFEYSMMKLGGATKLQLDIYLTDSRQKAFR